MHVISTKFKNNIEKVDVICSRDGLISKWLHMFNIMTYTYTYISRYGYEFQKVSMCFHFDTQGKIRHESTYLLHVNACKVTRKEMAAPF